MNVVVRGFCGARNTTNVFYRALIALRQMSRSTSSVVAALLHRAIGKLY
jgi:hypothetical protein